MKGAYPNANYINGGFIFETFMTVSNKTNRNIPSDDSPKTFIQWIQNC